MSSVNLGASVRHMRRRHESSRGTHRGAMGSHRTPVSGVAAARGWARSTSSRYPSGTQRSALGNAHRCTVGRSAGAVSAVPDLPQAFPGVGANGHATRGPGGAGRGSAKSRQTRPVGVLHRRDLRSREKRGSGVGKTKRGKGTKIMAVADRNGLPIAVHTESASPHEVTLVQATLEQSLLSERPTRLIGDKAYDSDKLDAELEQQGIELIAPHRSNRMGSKTQDGRVLRRYVRRWKIERLFAWLGNFRRLLHRWEYHLENYTGLVQLGCMLILLRNYF